MAKLIIISEMIVNSCGCTTKIQQGLFFLAETQSSQRKYGKSFKSTLRGLCVSARNFFREICRAPIPAESRISLVLKRNQQLFRNLLSKLVLYYIE